ncbi:cobyrinic acid a,c-diamide synthase [Halorhabdus sp. CUG00001]|uniref:cobyrinic acid a,c-diamide synthase n=1 Tax=Halorhabdus sp. CUG00001 TaxID=2600297 RepID=UPI00131B3444|nr:cobyrinic acid a,c-diamide synthase [Halorhabdus sp. CUG00001]
MTGLVVGGTASSVGKTVATLAIIRAFQREGLTVQPAKAGPDFIDPSHHETVVDRPSRTLDTWLEGREGLRRNYHRGEGDVCVIEGVMGVYDGHRSSTADVADALDLPVVLVVDASAGAESVAATALGFRTYAARTDLDVRVAGVIAQQAHGGSHEQAIWEALPAELQYCGRIPPDSDLEIPDRHLGLHLGDEAPIDENALDDAATHLRTDRLRAIAEEPAPDPGLQDGPALGDQPRVAIARDRAFRFVYPAVRERLATAGDLVTFSPVAGDGLPPADAIYLPGGYPERFAAELAASPTLSALADRAAEGVPIYGECGGFMALADSLRTTDGRRHDMSGILPATVEMCERYQALGHVELSADRRTLTADTGDSLRGHEFHYSRASLDSDATLAFTVDGEGIADGRDGLTEYETLGTYAHVHAASGAFDTLLERLR